jgi:hypothetical protein
MEMTGKVLRRLIQGVIQLEENNGKVEKKGENL